jgi:transcriptional regulator with XRE-family HTH domain
MTAKQRAQLRDVSPWPSGNRLGAAFILDGRSQMECSRETGFSPQYISDVKAGRFDYPSLENAHRFASFFGCAIEELFPSRDAIAS